MERDLTWLYVSYIADVFICLRLRGFPQVWFWQVLEGRETSQMDETPALVALDYEFRQSLTVDFWLDERVRFFGVVIWRDSRSATWAREISPTIDSREVYAVHVNLLRLVSPRLSCFALLRRDSINRFFRFLPEFYPN